MKRDTALVLSGGGARGAWQAGALAWICQQAPVRTGRSVSFDILVGSSVGSINAGFLAGEADDLHSASEGLWDHWSSTQVGAVYRLRLRRLWRVPRALLRGGRPARGPIALLDSGPLERIVRERIRWPAIEDALRRGTLQSVAFVATELAGARTTVFHQSAPDRTAPRPDRDRRFVVGPLSADHVLASVALPLLFPPVEVDGRWYLDGGLSEQAPVRTALQLGARRILSLGVQRPEPTTVDPTLPPTWPRVIGRTMDSVLADRCESELERMQRVNRVLEWGEGAYGEGFADGIAGALSDDQRGPWEATDALALHPSVDLGQLAAQALSGGLQGRVDDLTRVVFRFLEDTAGAGDADALSYLLFDPAYLDVLLRLGWEDAAARGDEIVEFLAGA
jgi:NTE family protein